MHDSDLHTVLSRAVRTIFKRARYTNTHIHNENEQPTTNKTEKKKKKKKKKKQKASLRVDFDVASMHDCYLHRKSPYAVRACRCIFANAVRGVLLNVGRLNARI